MLKKVLIVVVIYLFWIALPTIALPNELESLKFNEKIKLSQEKEIIAFCSEFSVLEDESFILNDVKDRKIMLFDRNGQWLKSWKTVGQGPGEYLGIWGNDYKHPYFGIYEQRTRKILLYQRKGKIEFEWIRDIIDPESYTKNFKIIENGIILDGPVLHKNTYYFFHIKDFEGKNDEYLLPAAVRYGKPPDFDYKKHEDDYRFTWGLPWSYLDFYQGYIYSCWQGMLSILKIDRVAKKWESFGHNTKNYNQPKVLKNTMSNRGKKDQWNKENERKFSWVVGLFVDEDIVGLMYLTFNKDKAYYETILQFYNNEGVFSKEVLLDGARNTYRIFKHYYSRDFGCFYVLNTIELDSGEVEFEILKYQIRS